MYVVRQMQHGAETDNRQLVVTVYEVAADLCLVCSGASISTYVAL